MLEAFLLGKPVLLLDGMLFNPPSKKTLGLLAYLMLEGTSSRAVLSALLWSEVDEEAARLSLRQTLHRLQNTALQGYLEVSAETLGLRAKPQTDVWRFKKRLESGDVEKAIELYRGSLLEGLVLRGATGFDGWLERERERLAQLKIAALERLAIQLEASGEPRRALVAHLEALAEDELRETHHREAMRLHYLLGEREAALERFERLKHVLRRDLALEPLPETVQLAKRIRASEILESLNPKPDPMRLLGHPPLVGREQAWAELERQRSGLVLIVGEPGIGKTRLAEAFAGASGSWLPLRGHQGSSATAFYPVAQALRLAFETRDLTSLEAVWRHEVARLVPEFAPELQFVESPAPSGRARFLEGLARALGVAAGLDGTLLLDDLQWFDADSLELIAHLLRRSGRKPRLLATVRTGELEEHQLAAPLMAGLEHEGLLQRISLTALSESDVLSMLQTLSNGTAGLEFAKQLQTNTAGNPFYLLETLRGLLESGWLLSTEHGDWLTPEQSNLELPIPTTVHAAIRQRIDGLGASVRRLLEVASLAGDDFGLEDLACASALSEWEALEGLERALRAGLVAVIGEKYGLSHDLIRRSLNNGLSDSRRKLIHRSLAVTLEANGANPASIADHLERAGRVKQAVPFYLEAAKAAARVFAHRQALAHYDKALEFGLDDRAVFEVRFHRLRLWKYLADSASCELELKALQSLAERLNDHALRVRTSITIANYALAASQPKKVLTAIEWVLTDPKVAALERFRALVAKSAALEQLGLIDQAMATCDEGLEQATDDLPEYRAAFSDILTICLEHCGETSLARAQNQQSLAYFQAANQPDGISRTLMREGIFAAESHNFQTATNSFKRAHELAGQIGDLELQRGALINLMSLSIHQGEVDTVLPLVENELEELQNTLNKGLLAQFLQTSSRCYLAKGDLGTALERAISALSAVGHFDHVARRISASLWMLELQLELGNVQVSSLESLQAEEDKIPTNDQSRLRWLEGRHCLALGNVQQALERFNAVASEPVGELFELDLNYWLATSDFALDRPLEALNALTNLHPAASENAKTLSLALELRIKTSLGQSLETAYQRVSERLSQANCAALPRLELLRALFEALEAQHQPDQALEVRTQAKNHLRALISSLRSHPDIQKIFLEKQRDLKV